MDKAASKKKNSEPVRSENLEEEISFLDALKMSKDEAMKVLSEDNQKPPAKGNQKKSV